MLVNISLELPLKDNHEAGLAVGCVPGLVVCFGRIQLFQEHIVGLQLIGVLVNKRDYLSLRHLNVCVKKKAVL